MYVSYPNMPQYIVYVHTINNLELKKPLEQFRNTSATF